MPTRNVVLTEAQSELLDRLVTSGRYQNASEVLRAGLRLLEQEEVELDALRGALIEGERSGAALPFDIEAFLVEQRGGGSA